MTIECKKALTIFVLEHPELKKYYRPDRFIKMLKILEAGIELITSVGEKDFLEIMEEH